MPRFRKTNKYVYLATVAIVLLVLLYFNIFDMIFSFLVYPVQQKIHTVAIGINRLSANHREINDFIRENDKLKQEKIALLEENAKVKVLAEENDLLRKNLNFFEKKLPDRNWVIGRVVGRSFDDRSVLIVDKGSVNGLKNGLPVVIGEGILIGKTSNVRDRRAKIILLTDSRSLVAGTIMGQTKTNNLIVGKYGLSLEMNLIPRNAEINDNDLVISSGLEDFTPRGLVIGQVKEIKATPNDLFQSAIVLPPISYDTVTIVAVLLSDD